MCALLAVSMPTFAGGLYLGVGAAAAFYDVDYQKAVDSTNPANTSPNAGRVFYASDTADAGTWDAGLLLGYRLGDALFLDVEADVVTHRGTASGRMAGAGPSPGNDRLGEVWPEDWSIAKERTYGLTLRGGAQIRTLQADVYVFVGRRWQDADFRTAYTGCLNAAGCPPGELYSGEEQHDDAFDATVFGAGLEKAFGSLALRGELRYSRGESDRVVPFDDVAVLVPVDLSSRELGVGFALIWRP